MLFWLWTQVGPRNHILLVGPDHFMRRGNFYRKEHARACSTNSAMSSAKMAEPIQMPFRLWTRVGPRKCALRGVHTGTTWWTPLIRRCVSVVQPVIKLLWSWLFVNNNNKQLIKVPCVCSVIACAWCRSRRWHPHSATRNSRSLCSAWIVWCSQMSIRRRAAGFARSCRALPTSLSWKTSSSVV